MNRLSTYTTSFASALILLFTAQSLLLAPNINTRLYASLPVKWLAFGGWLVFLASLAIISLLFLNPAKRIRIFIFITSALAMGTLGYLFFRQKMIGDSVLVIFLAVGLCAIAWEPTLSFDLIIRDWLPIFTIAINTVIGIGFLFTSINRYSIINDIPNRNIELLLGCIFIFPIVLGAFLFKKPQFMNGWFIRILALPWILWSLIIAVTTKDVSMLIPPVCLFSALLTIELIPWKILEIPAHDVLGHRVLFGILAANIIVIGLCSILIVKVDYILSLPINFHIYFTNIIILTVNLLFLISCFIIVIVNMTINGLMSDLSQISEPNIDINESIFYPAFWKRTIGYLVKPFIELQDKFEARLNQQVEENLNLTLEITKGKRRLTQLSLINELEQQLKPILDPPVIAQLTANAIQRSFDSALVTIFSYDFPRHEFVSLATSGERSSTVPPEYRQPTQSGLIGRAARLRKTQYAPDTRQDSDFFSLEHQPFLSEAAIPLLHQGLIKGMVVVDDEKPNAFSIMDIETLDAVGNLLIASWNRSNHDERLRELIRAGITLTTTLETEVVIHEIATTVQQTLAARFVFIALMDQQRLFTSTATSGYAPRLNNYLNLNLGANTVVQTIINSTRVHRMHDVRKLDEKINLDNINLRGFLGFPIHMRGQRIGAILVFGKQGGVYFTEEDESLATLISNQSSASIETTWLYQQLSTAFNTTTRLYDLSNEILKKEKLNDAAAAVIEAAIKLGKVKIAGIVLFTPQKEIEAQVQVDSEGKHTGKDHPMMLITQALINNHTAVIIKDQLATVCLPLATPQRQYGVLWLNIPETQWLNQRYSDDLHTLANQAALAMERGILLVETQQQREQIQSAYRELETTYDQTLISLSSALDVRDRETQGHSVRVGKLTFHLGKHLGLPTEQLKSLERGALLHDIGKIGISDNILRKPGPLDEDEWHAMRQHPDIGARIVEGIPFLQDAIPIIRYHQERWDGSGYPIGLKGEEIPLQARVFAVADVFDALTSTRPYRQRVTINEAVEYLRNKAGKDFDPKVVEVLEELVKEGEITKYLANENI